MKTLALTLALLSLPALATETVENPVRTVLSEWKGPACFKVVDVIHSGEVLPPQKICIEKLSLQADVLKAKVLLNVEGSSAIKGEFGYRVDERGIRATVWQYQRGGDSCNSMDLATVDIVIQLDAQDRIFGILSMEGASLSTTDMCHDQGTTTIVPYVADIEAETNQD